MKLGIWSAAMDFLKFLWIYYQCFNMNFGWVGVSLLLNTSNENHICWGQNTVFMLIFMLMSQNV